MDTGLLFAVVGLVVAGLAAVLGIWMERDPARPPRWAIGLSVLIGLATVVSLFQSVADAKAATKMEEDMARMLQTLDKLSSETGAEVPGLDEFLSKEMAAQKRSNPDVLQKMAERVAAEGGDPNAVLARHLPASELGNVNAKAVSAATAAEVEKLKKELAAARQKFAQAEAARQTSAKTAKEKAEQAQKNAEEKERAEKKLERLEKRLERMQKQNSSLRNKARNAGSRWEKG